jgi:hypothetical protein
MPKVGEDVNHVHPLPRACCAKTVRKLKKTLIWRPGRESNPFVTVLQTAAFPLRHPAIRRGFWHGWAGASTGAMRVATGRANDWTNP